MDTYSKRREYSDAHLETVKSALGCKLLKVSNLMQDTKLGYDLLVPALNIAVRVRQMKYSNYKDFTVRSSGGGDRSEYAKLLDKTAPDYIFYGYAMDVKTLAAGYLIDVKQWKLSLLLGEVKPQFRRNKDGSHFVAFPFKDSYAEQIV